MADFELSMDNSRFMNNFIEKVINGNSECSLLASASIPIWIA